MLSMELKNSVFTDSIVRPRDPGTTRGLRVA